MTRRNLLAALVRTGLTLAIALLGCKNGREPLATYCGDGERQSWERCDDGNRADGDGCSSTCKVEEDEESPGGDGGGGGGGGDSGGVCGDSVVDPGEGCDDGDTNDGDGCNGSCVIENTYPCSSGDASCDSGVCDVSGGAPGTCEPTDDCGNGVVETGEYCDDGNASDGDGCNNTCRIEDGEDCGAAGDASCASGDCDDAGGPPGTCAASNSAPVINPTQDATPDVPEYTTYVTTIAASDIDVGDQLTYDLVVGSNADQFEINPATGDLFLVASHPVTDGPYTVSVVVSDDHVPPATDQLELTITLLETNPVCETLDTLYDTSSYQTISAKATAGSMTGSDANDFDRVCNDGAGSSDYSDHLYRLVLPVPVAQLELTLFPPGDGSRDMTLALVDDIPDPAPALDPCDTAAANWCSDFNGAPESIETVSRTGLPAGTYWIVVDSLSSGAAAYSLEVHGTVAAGMSCAGSLFSATLPPLPVLSCATGTTCTGGYCVTD